MEATGLLLYGVAVLTMGGIYAILALGLNVQWGFTGLFNLGVAGFFAVGAYGSAIVTSPAVEGRLGGFEMPVALGLVAGGAIAAAVAWPIGRLTLRLKADYLAIGTIGIAEILRLVLKNEQQLTGGAMGLSGVPRPFEDLARPYDELAFLGLVAALVLAIYWALERARRAPWGRVLRAIRDNEGSAEAAGKDAMAFKLEAFVLGGAIMGVAGAVYAHYVKFIGPEAFEPLMSTFIVWVMLVAGGSGNNRGAILGAVLIWALWSATEVATSQLPVEWTTRAAYIRVFLIGLALQIILQRAPHGLLAETPPPPPRAPEVKDATGAARGVGGRPAS